MSVPSPQLIALSEGPNLSLDKPIVLIGRHQECDIQIPSRKISRKHCCLAQVEGGIVVRDLCSTNGIRINGMRVHEGQLKIGDELTIGNLRYQIGHAPATAPAPVELKSAPAPPAGEEMFDSCDEPIPLAEPGSYHGLPA